MAHSTAMEKVFNPDSIEKKWCAIWEEGHYYAPTPNAPKGPYCIMIPPPNVTGSLHMGHAFQDTIMDALTRYHRMQGHKTLWQMGTDHAGIATQMVVERQLQQQGTSRHDIGRERFVDKIWQWKEQSGGTICRQLRRLGASVDWSRERFTMDPGMSAAVQTVFIKLYQEGLIYRGQRLVNWDPVLLTAISDLEVESAEEQGSLWHIRYPIANSKEHLIVATTRPETMLGDTAVAVHPEDSRYQHLIGKKVKLPLTEREIPIIADDYVDQEFGTGCVKITPAHDFNDYEIGSRHDLPKINILTPDAKINDNAPEKYQGLDRFVARKQIVSDLEESDLLEKTEPHTLKVPRGDRSETVIEPYLTDQWFVKVDPLVQPAIDAVKNGEIKFIPENWDKTYYEWMNNLQDWCISRQLWWGHRIPAWYDEAGNIYVGADEDAIRKEHKLDHTVNLRQDEDVLDTWFSSALWPFSTLGWPEETPELAKFYPTNVLVTGFDIIFFWVARMVMFGIKFTGKVPFEEIYIHGLIQDHKGQKMSKSKGNSIDPLDLIDGISLENLIHKRTQGLMQPKMAEQIIKDTKKQFPKGIPEYGTDALRFTFCAMATNGRHLRFDLARLEGYRNFCTKIWNAARYVLQNTSDVTATCTTDTVIDKWILSKWQQVKQDFTKHFLDYRFDLAAHDIYDFTWNTFCDWYLELSKPNISTGTKQNLKFLLGEMMQLMHPIMPFITEEIWQLLGNTDYLITHDYPTIEPSLDAPEAEKTVELLQRIITAVRNFRGEMDLSPRQEIDILIPLQNKAGENIDEKGQKIIHENIQLLTALASIKHVRWENATQACYLGATGTTLEVLIPIHGLIEKDAAQNKIQNKIQKLDKEIAKCKAKLENAKFMQNAPEEVKQQEQQRLTDWQTQQQNYKQCLEHLDT